MKKLNATAPESKPSGATRIKNAQRWTILFPILALFLCLSCNDDDEDPAPVVTPPATSFLKATVNGTEYNFNRFVVETETVVGPDGYTDLHVIATIDGDDSKRVEFNLEQDAPGTESIYFFYLMTPDGEFDTDHTGAAFATNVTTNANRRIVGTYSGTLANVDNTNTVTVTNGSFDISY